MLRIKLVLLETGIDFRRIGEGAFQDGGGDGDDFEAVGLEDVHRLRDLSVREIHDVLAVDDAEFGALHPQLLHGCGGYRNVAGEFVCDGACSKTMHF